MSVRWSVCHANVQISKSEAFSIEKQHQTNLIHLIIPKLRSFMIKTFVYRGLIVGLPISFQFTDEAVCHGIASFLMYSVDTEIRGITLDATGGLPDATGADLTPSLATISHIKMAVAIDFYAGIPLFVILGNVFGPSSRFIVNTGTWINGTCISVVLQFI